MIRADEGDEKLYKQGSPWHSLQHGNEIYRGWGHLPDKWEYNSIFKMGATCSKALRLLL